jgi:hypothetical protein
MKNITKLHGILVDSIFMIDGPLDYQRVLDGLERLADVTVARLRSIL